MTAVVDTSVIVDVLRGVGAAKDLLVAEMRAERVHASEITRLEVLAGMRRKEEKATRLLLGILVWHPVDESTAERAGALGRQWLPPIAVSMAPTSRLQRRWTFSPPGF